MTAGDCKGSTMKGVRGEGWAGGSIWVKMSQAIFWLASTSSRNWNFRRFVVGYTGLKESSTEIMERDETLIICFLLFLWQKRMQYLKFTFNPWLLNYFDLPSYGSELRKRHTLRLCLMCLEGVLEVVLFVGVGCGEQITHLGKGVPEKG